MRSEADIGDNREADVVVVGAGLAGLVAARDLARVGLEPVVLEARDRVGGRVLGEPVGEAGSWRWAASRSGVATQPFAAWLPTWASSSSAFTTAAPTARTGDRDDAGGLAALADEHVPALVQAALGAPGDLNHAGVLARLAAGEVLADQRLVAVVVGGLDEQPSHVG